MSLPEFRDLQTPPTISAVGGEWMLLPLRWVLNVCDAFCLSHTLPSAAVTVGSLGSHVILRWGGEPYLVKPAAEWRDTLERWRPGHLSLTKD